MILRAFLVFVFALGCSIDAFSFKATTAHSLFFQKNASDSSYYDANILLNWRAQNSSLHIKKTAAGKFEVKLKCIVRWSTDTGVVKEDVYNINTPPRATYDEAYEQVIADQYAYTLPPGTYDIEMAIFEPDYKDQMYTYSDTVSVADLRNTQTFLSGIQLLDTFISSSVNSIYTRNGFVDFSLSSNYLDEKRQSISYYYEVYEANKSRKDICPIKINSYISWKPFSSPVPHFEHKDSINSSADYQFFHTNFPLDELKSGNYYLNIVLSNKYDQVIDKKSMFFQRYNPNPKIVAVEAPKVDTAAKKIVATELDSNGIAPVLDLTNTFVGKYNATQVRAVLKMLLLVCDPDEALSIQGFLKKPDELYSKYFIYNYWEKRDKQNPDKAWKAFTERIKEINRLFGGITNGYETDRGRVYIQYGKPDDRVTINNETGSLPYEIWQYYSTEKRGIPGIFLFYKPGRAAGDYVLLHSTIPGEKRNGNWRSLLYNNSITGTGTVNTESRAEQYIGNN